MNQAILTFLDKRRNMSWPRWWDKDMKLEDKIELIADALEELLTKLEEEKK